MMQHVQDYIRGAGSTDQLVDSAVSAKVGGAEEAISVDAHEIAG